jgi:hypothetical protein
VIGADLQWAVGEIERLRAIGSAASDLLATWDANEWAERAEGGELQKTVEALRKAVEASA